MRQGRGSGQGDRPGPLYPAGRRRSAPLACCGSPAPECRAAGPARGDRFLTAAYATFRVTPGGLAGRLCCAGHPPALVRRADGRVQQIDAPGSLLGIVPDIQLADVRFRLAPGDALLLYTDGATEAREQPSTSEAFRPLFGEDALADALAGTHGLDAATTISRLAQILARHTGDWASDDTALLVLRVPPRR